MALELGVGFVRIRDLVELGGSSALESTESADLIDGGAPDLAVLTNLRIHRTDGGPVPTLRPTARS